MANNAEPRRVPPHLVYDVSNVSADSRDLVAKLVRTYRTYAWSLSPQEQDEFQRMIQTNGHERNDGLQHPRNIRRNHIYRQMYDNRRRTWRRSNVTLANWALMAILYSEESLAELAKVVVYLGVDRQPCWQKYADYYDDARQIVDFNLRRLELPDASELAARCSQDIQFNASFGGVGRDSNAKDTSLIASGRHPHSSRLATSLAEAAQHIEADTPASSHEAQETGHAQALETGIREQTAAAVNCDDESSEMTELGADRFPSKRKLSKTDLALLQPAKKRRDRGRSASPSQTTTPQPGDANSAGKSGQPQSGLAQSREAVDGRALSEQYPDKTFPRVMRFLEAEVGSSALEYNPEVAEATRGAKEVKQVLWEDLNTTREDVKKIHRAQKEIRVGLDKTEQDGKRRVVELCLALNETMGDMRAEFHDSLEACRNHTTSLQRELGEALQKALTEREELKEEFQKTVDEQVQKAVDEKMGKVLEKMQKAFDEKMRKALDEERKRNDEERRKSDDRHQQALEEALKRMNEIIVQEINEDRIMAIIGNFLMGMPGWSNFVQ